LNVRFSFRSAASMLVTLAAAVAMISLGGCPKRGSDQGAAAKVNGRKIPRADVEKYFNNQTAASPQKPEGEQASSLRLSILKELIDNEIMLQRAEKLGLLATDEEVDSKINELKAPYTEEQFQQRLKDKNLAMDDLKREMRRNLTVDKVINKEITSKITVTDADISNYYNQHKSEFNLIEPQYHLARIIVTTQPNPQVHNLKNDKVQSAAAAKSKIQQLINRLDSGEDFPTVAMNYSEDPDTSGNGGDLGFLPEASLKNTDPATREAVLKLVPGRYSGVIALMLPQTKQVAGYEIVKLIAKEPAGQRDLNDPRVQQSIREQLRQRREQLLKAAYYEVVRDQAKVENFLAEEILKNTGQK